MHQIPVGPVHAGIIEPGHFRFTANGETVVRLEERLGYVHKGIDGLMAGATPRAGGEARRPRLRRQHRRLCDCLRARRRGGARAGAAAARRLAARADGRAGADRQPLRRHRRHLQRRLVLADPYALRHPARARAARGRRLLRPSADDGPRRARRRGGRSRQGRHRQPAHAHRDDPAALSRAGRALRQHRLAAAAHGDDGHPQRRPGAAVRRRRLRWPGIGAHVRCAQGAGLRALRQPALRCSRAAGGRCRRARVGAHRGGLPVGVAHRADSGRPARGRAAGRADAQDPPRDGGEGLALVEGFRGDILVWLRLGPDGKVARCHLRDPSWFQWPLLEAAIEGNIVADFPLCNKSFNCSYSGHDL